jgi:hypothetical protein
MKQAGMGRGLVMSGVQGVTKGISVSGLSENERVLAMSGEHLRFVN